MTAFGSETPAFYSDRLSARAGERVGLHISSPSSPCRIEVARVGAEREVVLTLADVAVGDHPTPPDADQNGCGWPEAVAFEVGADWRSGYYDIRLTTADGRTAHHMLVVKPTAATARIALVLTTNTLHAYNYWGGASAYCNLDALMTGRAPLAEAMEGAVGVLSAERPFPPMLLAPPKGMPRLVNLTPRGFEARPWAGADTAWSKAHRQTPYDGSAGFLHKWEHAFVEWAESEGIALDFFTDRDLEDEPGLLDAYPCAALVGHSEYWSAGQRDALERFVDQGGGLAILSGNTAFWKVRWEGAVLHCQKWKGFDHAAAKAEDATHLWSHPVFDKPEAAITGLTFLYGGYHRLGLCVARGAGGYTVYRSEHWALAGCDLYYGDVIGSALPLIGYENDGCLFDFGEDGLPRAIPKLGVPENLEIIALTPAAFAEAPSPYRPLIPPEQLPVVAKIAHGSASPAAQARMLRGHAVMASFRRGKGEVFNAGTTEWAHGLAAGDPFVTRITKNVLARFGGL
jgi:hypothetical protein